MMDHFLTIRYEVFQGDTSDHFLLPLPQTGICSLVKLTMLEDGQWQVTSMDTDASLHWIGYGNHKHEALLNYLKTRLGLYPDGDNE